MVRIERESDSVTRTAPTALRGYLMSCGVTAVDAVILEAMVALLDLKDLDSDALAGALLRSVSRCRRESYQEGYQDACEQLVGIRQSPLIVPALYEE